MKQGYAAGVGDQHLTQLQAGLLNSLPIWQCNTNINATIKSITNVDNYFRQCQSTSNKLYFNPSISPSVKSFSVAVILGNRREVFTRCVSCGVHTPGPFAY